MKDILGLKTSKIYKREIYIFFLIYLFINTLVIYKYATRQHFINPIFLSIIYAIFLWLIFFINYKIKFKERTYKWLFYLISLLFFIFSIWLNIHVDKFALKVDRWSAMEAGIKALFHNEYPYSALDHLKGQTSNLPALIFLGIPFYLIGDVGYLQSFTFIIFLIIISIYFKSYKIRFSALLLIIFSSTYCYDTYVKSDIISNFILLLTFVVLSEKYFKSESKKSIIINSLGSALLLMTRLVTVIPLTLALLKRFLNFKTKNKALFLLTFLLITIISFFIIFKNFGSLNNFMRYNPFYLQNSQLPFSLSLFCIFLSISYSFYVKSFNGLIKACTLILLITVLLSLIAKTIEFKGLQNSILNSRFDISYFNFVSPFLIFYITLIYDKINLNNKIDN